MAHSCEKSECCFLRSFLFLCLSAPVISLLCPQEVSSSCLPLPFIPASVPHSGWACIHPAPFPERWLLNNKRLWMPLAADWPTLVLCVLLLSAEPLAPVNPVPWFLVFRGCPETSLLADCLIRGEVSWWEPSLRARVSWLPLTDNPRLGVPAPALGRWLDSGTGLVSGRVTLFPKACLGGAASGVEQLLAGFCLPFPFSVWLQKCCLKEY